MPRSKKSAGAAASSPSPSSPGIGDVPPEVLHGTKSTTAAERFADWEESKILDLLKNEFGGGSFITLQRRHPMTSNGQWTSVACDFALDQFSIANVAAMLGGGDYRGRVRLANGQMTPKQFPFVIDHTIPPKNPQTPAVEKKEPEQQNLPELIKSIVAAVKPPEKDESGMVEIVKAALARPEPKSEITALTAIIEQMRIDARKSEERFMVFMQEMRDTRQDTQPRSLREQLLEAKELVDMIGGKGDGGKDEDSSWAKDLGKGIAEVALPFVKAHFAGGATAPSGPVATRRLTAAVESPPASNSQPAAATAAAPAGATPAQDTNPQPTEDMDVMMKLALARFQTMAIDAAKKGRELPIDFVGGVMKMVPEDKLTVVFNTANATDWFERLFAGNAEATKHLKYLNDVREAVLERALVFHLMQTQAGEKPQPAEQAVRDFIAWVTPDFRDYLGENCKAEPWGEIFALAIEDQRLTADFVEDARIQTGAQLEQLVEDPEKIVPMPTAAKKNPTGRAK